MSLRLEGANEDNILTLLSWNDEHAPLVAMTVDADLFSTRQYQQIARAVIPYIERFGHAPKAHLMDLLQDDLRRANQEARDLQRVLDSMMALAPHLDVEFVIAELEDFVRLRTKMIAVDAAYQALQGADETKADEALGGYYVDTPTTTTDALWLHDTDLSFLETQDGDFFSSGINALDDKMVRPERGTYTVLIAPKKAGKCIGADELVMLYDGSMKRIEDVVHDKDTHVISIDQHGNSVVTPVQQHWSNGEKPCYMMLTRTGRTLTTTNEHLYLTPQGWRMLETLVPGDYVVTSNHLDNFGKVSVEPQRARLLGYLIANGSLTKPNTPSFTKADPIIRTDFEECVRAMGDRVTWSGSVGWITSEPRWRHCNTTQWLQELGLIGTKSTHKSVPACVFTWDDSSIAAFLQGLFSCDGSIDTKHRIELALSNWNTVCQIKHLLARVGVFSRVRYFTAKLGVKQFDGYRRLSIYAKIDVLRFLNVVGFYGNKRDRADAAREYWADRKSHSRHCCVPWTKNFMYEKIEAILYVGLQQTYDLGIDHYHNFLANDVVVHNSWSCTNVGKANWRNRRSVLHISLENSVRLTKRRYLQAIFSMTRSQIDYLLVPQFNRDVQTGEFLNITHKQINPHALTMDNKSEILRRLDMMYNRPRLLIKAFPTGTLTISQLNAYLNHIERTEKFVPDVLIVDYPQLMNYDSRNQRIEIGRINMQLRGICVVRNMAGYAVAQGNRLSDTAQTVKSTHIAEDWSITGTADTILTYNQTAKERERGLARILVDAARDADDKFFVLMTQSYALGQFCIDSTYMNMKATLELQNLTSSEDDNNPQNET